MMKNVNCILCSTLCNISLDPEIIQSCENHYVCKRCIDKLDPYTPNPNDTFNMCEKCCKYFYPKRSIWRKSIFWSSPCYYCNKTKPIKSEYCPVHFPCLDCITTPNSVLQEKIKKKCYFCREVLNNSCRKCLLPVKGEKFKIPSCTQHFYCAHCATVGILKEHCPFCATFYDNITDHNCICCKTSHPEDIRLHNSHFICHSCYSNVVEVQSLLIHVIKCEGCRTKLKDFSQILALCSKNIPVSVPNQSSFSLNPINVACNFEGVTQNSGPSINYTSGTVNQPTSISIQTQIKKPILISCHGQNWEKLDCNHPACNICLGECFHQRYSAFIVALMNKNLEYLNGTEFYIGCYRNGCHYKYLYPFIKVREIAQNVLASNYMNLNLLGYYDSLFEGIPMRFIICRYCNECFGYMLYSVCIYCGAPN